MNCCLTVSRQHSWISCGRWSTCSRVGVSSITGVEGHYQLKKMLEIRVADGSLLRLIGKCLHVGVLEGESLSEPDLGTVQGSVLSPLMGHVYLHDVLDLWFKTEVKPRLRGRANLIRYCDDFIIGSERQDDAHRVQAGARQADGAL